jgi:uncharacterized membrane protein YecN with MAPEG domain
MNITALYAALLGLLFVALSVRALLMRRRFRIAVGDGGNNQMLRAMRVHANFAEYVPLSLLLLFMFELAGAPRALLHALCACLLLGRLAHAYGVSSVAENYRFRVFGMAMTFTALLGGAAGLLVLHAGRMVR